MTDATAAATEEPANILLSSAHVDSMKVASRDGASIGYVHALMVNKRSGQVAYAVLALGGFLGIGKSYYPLPFELLAFDPVADGYVVTVDKRILEGGPSWSSNAPDFNQPYADRVASYYGVASVDLALR